MGECEHPSLEGLSRKHLVHGVASWWQCQGCGGIELRSEDPNGAIHASAGRERSDAVLKALTIQQPWADAIIIGKKTIENRSWSTKHRGPLAIHAGERDSVRGWSDARIREVGLDRDYTVRGAIVGLAELVDCHPDTGCCSPWGEHSYLNADGSKTTQVFHWVLERAIPLDRPLAVKGRLSLWTIPPEVFARSIEA